MSNVDKNPVIVCFLYKDHETGNVYNVTLRSRNKIIIHDLNDFVIDMGIIMGGKSPYGESEAFYLLCDDKRVALLKRAHLAKWEIITHHSHPITDPDIMVYLQDVPVYRGALNLAPVVLHPGDKVICSENNADRLFICGNGPFVNEIMDQEVIDAALRGSLYLINNRLL